MNRSVNHNFINCSMNMWNYTFKIKRNNCQVTYFLFHLTYEIYTSPSLSPPSELDDEDMKSSSSKAETNMKITRKRFCTQHTLPFC